MTSSAAKLFTDFTEQRTAIIGQFESLNARIKSIPFKEALNECENFLTMLINDYGVNEKYLQTKGDDEGEGQPLSRLSFHFIPTDMAKMFVSEWKDSKNTDEFFQYILDFDAMWNILGTENRKIVSCTVDMTHRFLDELRSAENGAEMQKFLDSLNFSQIYSLSNMVSNSHEDAWVFYLFRKNLLSVPLSQAIDSIHLAKSLKKKEVLYDHVSSRKDFRDLSVNETLKIVDTTRSVTLAKRLLMRNDLPLDLFLLKASMS